MIYTNK